LAFGENLYCVFSTYFSVYFVVLRVVVWPMHGVIVSIFVTRILRAHFTLGSTRFRWGVASVLWVLPIIAELH